MISKSRILTIIRWFARILGLIYIVFWLLMFVGEGLSQTGETSGMASDDLIGIIAIFLYLLGLIIAWKWESIGGIAAIILVIVFALAVPNAPIPMYALMALPAILFVICWLMSRNLKSLEVHHH